jgi:pullulanase/glycogen debranching enzyme
MTIGEGWKMGTELPMERLAHQKNAALMPGIGHFNDDFRDAIKGNIFLYDQPGFISGMMDVEPVIQAGIAGGIAFSPGIKQFAVEPQQNVNYVECHDNHTLWDKIVLSTEGETFTQRRSMHRLASAIVFMSQGIPFIHAGQEFMRTKDGVENSYKSSVEINRMDWELCAVHQEDVTYMKHLIALRKAHPAFRMRTADDIRNHLVFEKAPASAVAYTLRSHAGGDAAKHIYVLFNANAEQTTVVLPQLGAWETIFGADLTQDLTGNKLTVNGIGTVVLTAR